MTAHGLAVSATLFVDGLWLMLPGGWSTHIPYSLFVIVVGAAALFGGIWPGMLAVVLGFLSASFLGQPRFPWALDDRSHWVALGVFIVSGPLAAFGCAALRRARQEAEQLNARLEESLRSERAARAELERAGRLKDEFVATVSHELRTPLNAVLGWAELLQRPDVERARIDRGVTVILRNGRALGRLVSDLLDVSRMLAGKVRLDMARHSLPDVVEAALLGLRGAAEAKRIEIATDLAAVEVLADADRLQQVVYNLVSNAVKFTPEGGRVSVSVGRDERGRVALLVRDTGEGVDPEFVPHMFERFRQSDASLRRHHGGLGIGLAICRHLVELHGGTIAARSEGKGRGCEITVSLPSPPASPRDPASGTRLRSTRALAGVTVLVVDDDPDAREIAQRILEEHGASVLAASSGPEALDKLHASHPDVLVSDIGMPEMDGLELMRRLRAAGDGAALRTPAIALTAYARAEDRELALAVGYQGHVAKPVDAAELVAAVEEACRGARDQPAGAVASGSS